MAASLHVARVFRHEGANVGRRARFRRATREDGDGEGGRAMREDDDGRGRASRGETLWGRPDRARGSRASVARARANGVVMRARYRSVRMKRSGGFVRCAGAGDGARGTRMGTMDVSRDAMDERDD